MSEPEYANTLVTVEKAGIADLELLLDWRARLLHAVFNLPDNANIAPLIRRSRSYFEDSLTDGTHIACFASIDGQRVGCGGVCLQREMPSPDNASGTCAYLMNIYTSPEARGQGVSRAVVKWLIRQAQARNAEDIPRSHTAGRHVYEKTGFIDMPHMMVLAKTE